MSDTTPSSDLSPYPTCLADRALLRIAGAEARAFLNGLVTQNVLTLEPNQPRWAGLLSPQGKALFDFMLWADGPEDVLIDCEIGVVDALMRRLTLYRLRRPVEIARDESRAVHWSLENVSAPLDPRLPALGHRWIAPVSAGHDAGDASGAWHSHRWALGVPEGVAELGSDQTLWLEANGQELNGVDYTKGCYVGQENTARMHYRQKVNRRLVIVPRALSDVSRQRLDLPDANLAIDFRRVEDMVDLPLPEWQARAIAAADQV